MEELEAAVEEGDSASHAEDDTSRVTEEEREQLKEASAFDPQKPPSRERQRLRRQRSLR